MGAAPTEAAMRPDETVARMRQDIGNDDPATGMYALLNAAECSSCAFRHKNQCRAWPPRPLADGRPVWPEITMTDWCGCWRAL